jgi:hypothetical protein
MAFNGTTFQPKVASVIRQFPNYFITFWVLNALSYPGDQGASRKANPHFLLTLAD